jgi:hypothetical protein
MALPQVNITLANGALGLVPPNEDAVAGFVANGVAATGLALGVSHQGFSLPEFEALGITEAYDTANSVRVWRELREFYDAAGSGSELWLLLVSQATNMQAILDKTQLFAKKLLSDAGGRIRLLGVGRNPASGYTPSTTANQIDLDVINALTTGQALADEQFDLFTPIRIVIPGYAFTGTTSSLANLKAQTRRNVAVLIGGTSGGAACAVGLLLGRLASDPVQRNPGRVKSGSLPILAAYLGSATLETAGSGASTAIHDKGFITLRKYAGKAGYYFSDDPTATAATDDYSSLARGRVIDKAVRLTYAAYVEEILDEVRVNPENGQISAAQAGYYRAIVERVINNTMTANDEIEAVDALVEPAQNVLGTNKICIDLRITLVGYAKDIQVTLGFTNPALN